MEKSKAEIYMDRLQKWREEKQKKQIGNKNVKQNQRPEQKATVPKSTYRPPQPLKPRSQETNFKSRSQETNFKPRSQETNFKPHTLKPSVNKSGTTVNKSGTVQKCGTVKPGTINKSGTIVNKTSKTSVAQKPVGPAAQSKPVQTARNTSEMEPKTDYLQKYQQWKEEKEKTKSEKKLNPGSCSSSMKPAKTDIYPAKSTEKPVRAKSRLFDFMHQGKYKTDKENKTSRKSVGDLTQNKTVKPAGVKRRRSFTIQGPPAKRNPVGILKRKSCIGSFDFDIKGKHTDTSNEVKSQSEQEDEHVFPTAISPKTPSRNVRFISPENAGTSKGADGKVLRKTPLKRQNLNEWLESNDKTPSKFRHLLCFHGDHGEHEHDPVKDLLAESFLSTVDLADQANALEVERLTAEAMEKLDSMLDECMTLFEAGCPREAILPWLDDIFTKIPIARTSVKFYSCKVDVLKESLNLDEVLKIIEEATINDAKPKTELANMLTETVKYVTDKKVKLATKEHRRRRRSQVQEENVFASSAIVYTVGNVTPFSDRKQKHNQAKQTDECRVVTPVRRSTRRSLQNLPESLKEKRRTLTSLTDLEDKDNVLFKPNLALEKEFDAAAADSTEY